MVDGMRLQATEELERRNEGRINEISARLKNLEDQIIERGERRASFEQRIEDRFQQILKLLNVNNEGSEGKEFMVEEGPILEESVTKGNGYSLEKQQQSSTGFGVQHLPELVLIDDGRQSLHHDDDPVKEEGMNKIAADERTYQLMKFEDTYKFRDYESPKKSESSGYIKRMGVFDRDLKDEFKTMDHVYLWHELCGFWGRLRSNVPGLPKSKGVGPKLSPGVERMMEKKLDGGMSFFVFDPGGKEENRQ